MKAGYSKPTIEIEVYNLSEDIAANCGHTVSLGPEAPGHEVCEEFDDAFNVASFSLASAGNTPFYDDGSANCDCYYSSGGGNYFTS